MNASRVVRLMLALVCIATVFISLFAPLALGRNYGMENDISISYLIGEADKVNGSLGLLVKYLFFIFAIMWVVTAILALVFPVSKKAPGTMGLVGGCITFIASSLLLIGLLSTDALGSALGLSSGGESAIGFGAIGAPLFCIAIIVLSLPEGTERAEHGAAQSAAPAYVPRLNEAPAQNYPQQGYQQQNYPAQNYPAQQPRVSARIIGVAGDYSGASFDISPTASP